MACYKPRKGWRSSHPNENGKYPITFRDWLGSGDVIMLPCGHCIGCRLELTSQWAVRCVHEASFHDYNAFVTLTYNTKNLPDDNSVSLRVLQLFMKRVRKQFGKDIKFYACGEYGDKLGRPHYHLCLFGVNFTDKTIWKKTQDDGILYRSAKLEKLWPFGYSSIGDVTQKSAAYVARYVMKKITGPKAEKHYNGRKPEFTTMSNGLGLEWFQEYHQDIYPDDFIIIDGKKTTVPRYYDKQLEARDPDAFETIKEKRITNAQKHEENNTPERLKVRSLIQEYKLRQLPRNHDLEE